LRGDELALFTEVLSVFHIIQDPVTEKITRAFEGLHAHDIHSGFLGAPPYRQGSRLLDTALADAIDEQDIRNRTNLSILEKAYVMQERFASSFEQIKRMYQDIFPSVRDLKIERHRLSEELFLAPMIQEDGVDGWFSSLSSGMERALRYILELSLLPDECVLLIDEYENGLGINCLPTLTELLLREAQSRGRQLIMTSHHPYIISHIPEKYWKLVQRRGSRVSIRPASEVLGTSRSKQDSFIRLINSDAYLEGIQTDDVVSG
jgi:ABC-type glutathione transport system ATPase component